MPLRKIVSGSSLSAEDISLLEAVFNQTSCRFAAEEVRYALARDLVALFTAGVKEEAELIRRLAEYMPSVKRCP